MWRILFIEDDESSVRPVIDELDRRFKSQVADFSHAERALRDFLPHIVVLDIFRGPHTGGDCPGNDTYKWIWNHRFCPIVIFSARPDAVDDAIPSPHPFIKHVQKGSGSERKVMACIDGYLPYVEALEGVQSEIGQRMNEALQHTVPLLLGSSGPPDKDLLVRTARRRVAAMMDDAIGLFGGKLASSELYLYPPVNQGHLLAGDIIMRVSGSPQEPEDFYVILTPSCDLACDEKRKSKVSSALVARCEKVVSMLSAIRAHTRRKEMKDISGSLKGYLDQGYFFSYLPLPGYANVIPVMVANMRKLELIELGRIGLTDECDFVRVASVDSPFRELIIWAYLQTGCRPGLPERDVESWAREMLSWDVSLAEPFTGDSSD